MQERAANKMLNIAKLEFNISKKLLSIVNSNELISPDNTNNIEYLSHNNIRNITNVGLSYLFNCNAFGNFSDNCTADLTGYNKFLLSEMLPTSNTLNISNMNFTFPKIEIGKCDNISCQSQHIFIDNDYYSSIMILGCAKRGSYSDILHIKYFTGVYEDISIYLTDFGRMPEYNENIAWVGKGAEIKNKKAQYLSNNPNIKLYLFAKEYFINNNKVAEQILLPECPNKHIFAISLRKRNRQH